MTWNGQSRSANATRMLPAAFAVAWLVAGYGRAHADAASAAPGGDTSAHASGHHARNQSPVVFGADDVTYDDQLGVVVARGNVELSQGKRTVFADTMSYNERSDTVTASGHVTMISETGDTVFGNYVVLSNTMRDGFIKDIRILMADRSRLAGNTGLRTNGNRTEIRRGVYSPCDLCADDPSAPPLWQLKAARIIHNQNLHLVEYENVAMEIDGVPILWLPYLSHPDPSVRRADGLLAPSLGSSTILGYHTTIPYYFTFGPDADFTFEPIFSSTLGVDLVGQYRQVFVHGNLNITASAIDANNSYNTAGQLVTQGAFRGHVFADAAFDLNDQFRASVNIQRTTDKTYLQEFNFASTNSFLTSDALVEDFDGRNYGSLSTYAFQTLRLGTIDDAQPIVLPALDYTWYGRPMAWGGRFTTNANAIDLFRFDGVSERRMSLGTRLDLPFTTGNGQVFNALATVRGDGYDVGSVPLPGPGSRTFTGTTGRVFPQLGLEWRWPFVRYAAHSSITIEPMAAVYAAPVGGNSAKIPNEDSIAFDYGDSDLFVPNRLAGYDQVDGGQRVDYGVHGEWLGADASHVDLLFGQSYRLQRNSIFEPDSGLGQRRSDYVGRLQVTPGSFFDVTYRFRTSENDFRAERHEIATSFGPGTVRFGVSYIYLRPNIRDEQSDTQQVAFSLGAIINDNWSTQIYATHNLSGSGSDVTNGYTTNAVSNLSNSFSIQYSNECLIFQGVLTQGGTHIGALRAGTSILFQLVFKNLGELGLPSIRPFQQEPT